MHHIERTLIVHKELTHLLTVFGCILIFSSSSVGVTTNVVRITELASLAQNKRMLVSAIIEMATSLRWR